MKKMDKPCQIIIDGNYMGYRSWSQSMMNLSCERNGVIVPTGTIYSFINDLLDLHRTFRGGEFYQNPEMIVAWDCAPTVRKAIDPSYKANRSKKGNTNYSRMKVQLIELQRFLPYMGIKQYWCEGYEADDIVATLCHRSSWKVVVVARDKDLYQVLKDGIYLYDFKDIKDIKWFRQEFGIEPYQWIEVQSLAGDSVDNVEGVKGIGIKTAIKMVSSLGEVENMCDLIGDEFDKVLLAKELVTLITNLNLEGVEPILDKKKVIGLLERKGISAIQKKSEFDSFMSRRII